MSTAKQLKDKLKNATLSRELISVYDIEEHSVIELLYYLARELNNVLKDVDKFEADVVELVEKMADELDELLRGGKVESEILKTLIDWRDNGTFDHLIQHSVFKDYEERLEGIEGEFPILKSEVQKTLEETKQQVGSFNEYSLTDYPIFHKTLYGAGTSVMQQFAKLKTNTWLFSQTNADGAPSEGESFTISRLDNNGETLDYMRVYRGGHGLFQVIEKGSTMELYFTDDRDRLIKTTYQGGAILDLSTDHGYTVLPKYSSERQLMAIDSKNDLLMLISRNSLKVYYKADIYRLSDYLSGEQTSPHATLYDTTPEGQTLQGIGIHGNLAIIYHGTLGDKCMIRAYDIEKGTYKDHIYKKLGYTSSNADNKTVVEGEGAFFDENGNLYIGVSTGSPGTIRANHVYIFATVKQSRDFISQTLENAQTFKLTEGNGNAQWFDPKPSKLSKIQKPGWYYFTSTEFDFSDVPEEYKGVSAYWLFVSPRGKDGTVYQEIIRNTSGVNQYRLTRQILFDGTPSKWVSVGPERKTLHSGDTRTTTTITLSDSIENYDFLVVRIWGPGGRYTTETINIPQIISDKKMYFHSINLPDSSGTNLYFLEMEVSVSDDFRTLTQTRKTQIKLGSGEPERIDEAEIGIHNIQGIRGFVAL